MMEAKDTVMGDLDLIKQVSDWVKSGSKDVIDLAMSVRQAQAEISFKAGYEKCAGELETYLLKWKKAGIREVVDWFREFIYQKQGGIGILVPPATYEAKLEEWGIE